MGTTQSIDGHRSRGAPLRAGARAAIVALVLAAMPPAPGAAQTQVYRCQGPNGAAEFRQEPCAAENQGETLIIEDLPTGWTLTPTNQGDKEDPAPPVPKKKKASQRRSGAATARERTERECGKKRQQVEDIDRRLRLGTSGRQGTELRHKRHGLEDFLFENCN
jgi:hypothetical protein